MVDISGSYDPNAEVSQFDRLPPFSDQRAKIIESEIIPISDKEDLGKCLNLTWQIETGPLDGRLFWQRINMWWTGPEKKPGTVVQIANSQFAAIRQATGKMTPQNTTELHHIPCLVSYGPQKKNPDYDEVKSVKPVGGAAPAVQNGQQQRFTAPAGNAAPANNGGGTSAPWRQSQTA